MKKLYTLIFASAFALTANAVTIPVSVGGATNAFSPTTFTANIGDVVVWTWAGGTHNVTSLSVPSGAAAFASPTQSSGTFSYTITTAGNYGYECTLHAASGMFGGFSVTAATGITEPVVNLITTAYPNPFQDKFTVKYNGIQSLEIYNVVGEKIRTIKLEATETKLEVDFTDLPSGVYFYRTFKDGNIVETKRIVKAK